MLEKYTATIQGDRIEWDDEVPPEVIDKKSVNVIITLIDRPVPRSKTDAARAVAALQAIADRGGMKSIPDPVKWQREIRKDRELPGQ